MNICFKCGNTSEFIEDNIDSEFYQKNYIECLFCGEILEWYECDIDNDGNIVSEFWFGEQVL